MKIVIDTNALVAAFMFKGKAAQVYDYCVKHEQCFVSHAVIDEFELILKTKFEIPYDFIQEMKDCILQKCQLIEPYGHPPNDFFDIDDSKVLFVATYIKADYILTGDANLLIMKRHKDTDILSPENFIKKWES